MEIGIVGGGVAGLSTAWALTGAGHRVTLFEQGPVPNPLSASGDRHRIIRRGYGALGGYARTIEDAFDGWEALWRDLGERHYAPTGVLCVSRFPGDESDRFTRGYDEAGTPYERYEAAEAAARWPFLDGAAIDYATLQPDGGVLFCERIGRGLAGWLRAQGATVREHTPVTAVDPDAGVVTAGGAHRFDAVVVTAGAWVTALFPDLAGRLTTYRTAVAYLAPPPDLAEAWARAPAFLSVGGDDVGGYVLPPVGGTGLKVGAEVHRRQGPANLGRAPEPGEGERLRDLFGPPFARIAEYGVTEVRTCAYTFTADERFHAERRGRTWIVSACSGHGYKFGAEVGRRVARAVESGDEAGLVRWIEAQD